MNKDSYYMITISIIIPFYDKDYHNIPNMLIYLSKLTFNKEVIFIDDRNDKSIDIRKEYNVPNEYKIINSSKEENNIGTFEARRTGTLNATGDYIWFVDVDDEPLNIDFSIDENDLKEIYVYTYITTYLKSNNYFLSKFVNIDKSTNFNNNDIINLSINTRNIKIFTNFFKNQIFFNDSLFFYAIYNKFIKRDLLIKTYKSLPILKKFILGEDLFLILIALNKLLENENSRIQLKNTPIYNYKLTNPYKYTFSTLKKIKINKSYYKNLYSMYAFYKTKFSFINAYIDHMSIFK